MKETKFIIIFLSLFFLLPIIQPVYAEKDLSCSSYEAIYVPSGSKIDPENPPEYRYQMLVEETGKIRAGEAWSQFVIEILDKNETVVTRLKLPYNCGHGSAPVCNVHYVVENSAGKKDVKDLNVFSLNKDFSRGYDVVRPGHMGSNSAPHVVIFPRFTSVAYYTNWKFVSPEYVEYLTKDRVYPKEGELWKLSECLNGDKK